MYNLLANMTVIEASSFIASPSAGLHLAQMGAQIIRIDHIGGGPDFRRWPKSDHGASFYWEGLNKAKKSIALNLACEDGRALAQRLAAAPGENGGLFLTNYPVNGFLSHERLRLLREDLITVRVMGQADGGPALDYTVNSAIGIPLITGPASFGHEPVNHVLPAWDLMCGAYAAFMMLAAERHRRDTGQGQEVRIPLTDLAIASVANLGQIAEVLYNDANRERYGNDVFGSFGRDFVTADGKRLMIMALTPGQWSGLVEVLGIDVEVTAIELERNVSFARDEGSRFEHRDVLNPLVAGRVAKRQSSELMQSFDQHKVCWGPYQTMREAADDAGLIRDNPVFTVAANPSGISYPIPGAPATLPSAKRQPSQPAPHLGANTEEVLAGLLGLSSAEIGKLIDQGVVACANG